jgi:hypothetical protein
MTKPGEHGSPLFDHLHVLSAVCAWMSRDWSSTGTAMLLASEWLAASNRRKKLNIVAQRTEACWEERRSNQKRWKW